jgi:hypothetical protein
VSVRPATIEDLPQLLGWAAAFADYHPLTRAAGHDPASVETMMRAMIADPDKALLMHAHGAIGGIVAPMWLNPRVRVATELFWWASRDGLQLMRAFEDWAREQDVDVVQMIAILGVDRDVTSIYDRAGYLPAELNFVKAAG